MKLKTIIQTLNNIAPPQYACEWDTRLGLQLGDKNAEIKKILVSLNVTADIVKSHTVCYEARTIKAQCEHRCRICFPRVGMGNYLKHRKDGRTNKCLITKEVKS